MWSFERGTRSKLHLPGKPTIISRVGKSQPIIQVKIKKAPALNGGFLLFVFGGQGVVAQVRGDRGRGVQPVFLDLADAVAHLGQDPGDFFFHVLE